MAAMVGGTTGAVLTATIMTFEMTRDYTVILPVILTVVVATAVRQALLPATIYTLKLHWRGHQVPQGLQAWNGERKSQHIMSDNFQVLLEKEADNKQASQLAQDNEGVLVLIDAKHSIVAVVGPWCDYNISQITSSDFITVSRDESASAVLRRLRESGSRAALSYPMPPPTALQIQLYWVSLHRGKLR